jgi:hypothetical protein
MKKILIIILLPIIEFHPLVKNDSNTTQSDKSTFTDLKNGYKINVSKDVSLRGGCYHWPTHPDNTDTGYIKILYKEKRIIFGDFEEIKNPIKNDSDFMKFCIERGILSSSADGPDGGTYCENIDSGSVKVNQYGVKYAVIFLKKFETYYDSTINYIAGPYYFIDISNEKKKQTIYLDCRPNDGLPSVDQVNVSKEIINNIKLIK